MPRWGLTPHQGGPGPRRAELPAWVGRPGPCSLSGPGPGPQAPRGRAGLEAGLQPLLLRPAPGRTQRPELTAEGSAPPAALLCPQRAPARCWKVRSLACSPHAQLNRQEGPRGAQGGPGTTPSRPTAEGLKRGAPSTRGAPATVFSIPQTGPGPALQTEEAELSHGVPAAAGGEAGPLPRGLSLGHRLVAEPRAGLP